jgi:hypothetical protein
LDAKAVVGELPLSVGLVDQRLPHQPPAEAERAEHVIQGHPLLGPAPPRLVRGVEVIFSGGPVRAVIRAGDHLHDPGDVVVTGLP